MSSSFFQPARMDRDHLLTVTHSHNPTQFLEVSHRLVYRVHGIVVMFDAQRSQQIADVRHTVEMCQQGTDETFLRRTET